MIGKIREYWNERIHDLEMAKHPVATREFFDDLDDYRFDKLRYLPRLVDFNGHKGRRLLEVGCGIGIDLVRFAKGGARVTGVDLSETAIRLTRTNFQSRGMSNGAQMIIGNGEQLPFAENTFDVVYAHGVIQYTADAARLIADCRRVLKPGGDGIFMVYNRVSWLNALSKVMKVGLEHEDAPVLRKFTAAELREMLRGFSEVRIIPERFPVKSRLHHGWKAAVYNGLFVGVFNALPRSLVRRFGWHLMGLCRK
ncbi:MAG: methyltransferase domain-containing protein [Acidobacteria bacterium]|nr:methyltransferase domain-containing protein [Acidobacteriota bacterium]